MPGFSFLPASFCPPRVVAGRVLPSCLCPWRNLSLHDWPISRQQRDLFDGEAAIDRPGDISHGRLCRWRDRRRCGGRSGAGGAVQKRRGDAGGRIHFRDRGASGRRRRQSLCRQLSQQWRHRKSAARRGSLATLHDAARRQYRQRHSLRPRRPDVCRRLQEAQRVRHQSRRNPAAGVFSLRRIPSAERSCDRA